MKENEAFNEIGIGGGDLPPSLEKRMNKLSKVGLMNI